MKRSRIGWIIRDQVSNQVERQVSVHVQHWVFTKVELRLARKLDNQVKINLRMQLPLELR